MLNETSMFRAGRAMNFRPVSIHFQCATKVLQTLRFRVTLTADSSSLASIRRPLGHPSNIVERHTATRETTWDLPAEPVTKRFYWR